MSNGQNTTTVDTTSLHLMKDIFDKWQSEAMENRHQRLQAGDPVGTLVNGEIERLMGLSSLLVSAAIKDDQTNLNRVLDNVSYNTPEFAIERTPKESLTLLIWALVDVFEDDESKVLVVLDLVESLLKAG